MIGFPLNLYRYLIALVLIMLMYVSDGQGLQSRVSGLSGAGRSSSSTANRPPPQGLKEIFPPREHDWKPSMFRLQYDVIPLGVSIFDDGKKRYSFQAMTDFDIYFFTVEYGHEETTRGATYTYTNRGNYFSFGPEVNFLKYAQNGTAFNFGLKYGQANFSDELRFFADSTFYGDYEVIKGHDKLIARWLELTLSLSTTITKGLNMGYTVRYKVLRSIKNIGDIAPYDVPGFGLYEDNTGVRFNFYIGWTFRWREKEPLLPLGKK